MESYTDELPVQVDSCIGSENGNCGSFSSGRISRTCEMSFVLASSCELARSSPENFIALTVILGYRSNRLPFFKHELFDQFVG